MDFELLQEFVIPVIMVACLLVGEIVKRWITDVDNKFIPTIVGILGIVFNVWLNNWTLTFNIFVTGLASGLASTGAFEMIKHLMKKDGCSDELR